ncbi:LOW QUALITY PROTEIN: prenylated Rab acceptor protein 1 [Poecile atricapillus]|uniref:LOW QUALITY PROTEIN: prenylated Rab acceptor protein 1 n=1 Tax=Poecile atricapillus TaxID=48891 RepID=UPI002738EF50|nr:LOW QUALITY PROTEIN: prenylated Rab acceptor protein 1 [Poecile atricapillus]
MAEPKPLPQELLFNPESDPRAGLGRLSPPGWVRQRLEEIWGGVRPWGSFLDQRRFGVPRDFGELCRRLGHNAERFQSNYLILFLGLVLYCLLTSPLLLVALGVFVGAAVAVRLRAREAPLVILGRELGPAHQLGVAGGVSLPLFWLAGAGAAVFWVLGAALVFLGSHGAFRQPEPPESPELQMEPV